jgi:hypothetical protein
VVQCEPNEVPRVTQHLEMCVTMNAASACRPRIIPTLTFIALLILCLEDFASAQTTPHLKIRISPPATIEVEGAGMKPLERWSFHNSIAGTMGLADRVREFSVKGVGGLEVGLRKLASGEYRAEQASSSFRYRLELPPLKNSEVAHVSLLSEQFGLLMLRDVLPAGIEECMLELEVPPAWTIHSSAPVLSERLYRIQDPESSVFFVGPIRKLEKQVRGMRVDLLTTGPLPVPDKILLKSSEKILERYLELTGKLPSNKVVIAVAPFRFSAGSSRWKAETIGTTSVIFVDDQASSSNWKGQFGIIFTHELFHLWVPNALRLEGDYDWFFEGFTLYSALLTSLRLKLISFQEYLDTMARVYDSYLSYPDISLIDASERRWLGNGAAVYDKGMLTAFLYDLTLRRDSHSSKTVLDLYGRLFSETTVNPANANEVIIRLLGSENRSFSKSQIESASKLDLNDVLLEFGLELGSRGSNSKITAVQRPTPAQKQLLKSLRNRN